MKGTPYIDIKEKRQEPVKAKRGKNIGEAMKMIAGKGSEQEMPAGWSKYGNWRLNLVVEKLTTLKSLKIYI